jgi:hypothetical protein
MKSTFVIMSCLFPSLLLAETLTGVAKNAKGETVYVEKHDIQIDESGLKKMIQVKYLKPDGTVFATMNSDFSKNKNVPNTIFEDSRFNTKTTLTVSGDNVVFEEFKNEKQIDKKVVPLKENMVASQGFDNFIKSNSEELGKKPLTFKFGVLDLKDFFSLTGYKKASSSADTVEYGIRASSWILRFFADELRVVYDPKDMRIKSFMGKSNILDDSMKSQNVTITYQWADNS